MPKIKNYNHTHKIQKYNHTPMTNYNSTKKSKNLKSHTKTNYNHTAITENNLHQTPLHKFTNMYLRQLKNALYHLEAHKSNDQLISKVIISHHFILAVLYKTCNNQKIYFLML